MKPITLTAQAFSDDKVREHTVWIDENDVVRVWDSVANHYTVCHLLSFDALQDWAANRLEQLGLNRALAIDESGQTSHAEHIAWILTASDQEIYDWSYSHVENS